MHAGIIRNSWAVLRAYHNCTNQPSLICLQRSCEQTPWLTFVYRPVNKMELRKLAILLVLSVVLHMVKSQGKRLLYIPSTFVRQNVIQCSFVFYEIVNYIICLCEIFERYYFNRTDNNMNNVRANTRIDAHYSQSG